MLFLIYPSTFLHYTEPVPVRKREQGCCTGDIKVSRVEARVGGSGKQERGRGSPGLSIEPKFILRRKGLVLALLIKCVLEVKRY
jgi:hypothetical protein